MNKTDKNTNRVINMYSFDRVKEIIADRIDNYVRLTDDYKKEASKFSSFYGKIPAFFKYASKLEEKAKEFQTRIDELQCLFQAIVMEEEQC